MSIALLVAHLGQDRRERGLTTFPLGYGSQVRQRPFRRAGASSGDQSFDAARRERDELCDGSSAVGDGDDLSGGRVGHHGGRVLFQCSDPYRLHVLHGSTLSRAGGSPRTKGIEGGLTPFSLLEAAVRTNHSHQQPGSQSRNPLLSMGLPGWTLWDGFQTLHRSWKPLQNRGRGGRNGRERPLVAIGMGT